MSSFKSLCQTRHVEVQGHCQLISIEYRISYRWQHMLPVNWWHFLSGTPQEIEARITVEMRNVIFCRDLNAAEVLCWLITPLPGLPCLSLLGDFNAQKWLANLSCNVVKDVAYSCGLISWRKVTWSVLGIILQICLQCSPQLYSWMTHACVAHGELLMVL